MELIIPKSVRTEHEELHRELAAATKVAGRVGEAARAVAKLLHPHFVDEEAFALPPLAALAPLMRGERIFDVGVIGRFVQNCTLSRLREGHSVNIT